jgi:iron complex transport system ATP-binding protein
LIILDALDLHFEYAPQRPTLRSVSLQIESGSMAAIIGSNGCGKSTLIRLLGGLLQPKKGKVLYRGLPFRHQDRRRFARQLAYVPQTTSRAFPFTSLEVVLTGRTPHTSPFRLEDTTDVKQAMEALETVAMSHVAHRRITELSGGERQLVSVARALAQQPECILLDEPSSSLDLKHRAGLIRTLTDLRSRTGLTVVMVTHDLALLDPGFDHVFALRCGTVAASGSPADVLRDSVLAETYDDPYVRTGRVDGHLCVWSEVHA